MMHVMIKGRHVVKPAEATQKGSVALSELDQVAGATYVPLIYLFNKPNVDEEGWPMIDGLKESLSRALVHYYPLAGRLRRVNVGRMQLECNAEGVELIEAESSTSLSDFGDFSDTRKFQHLIPAVDLKSAVEDLPLLILQFTRLRCGGVTLGMMMSHGVADGSSAFCFITDWARIARGEPLESYPFHDRTILRAGQPPQEQPPGSEQMESHLKLLIKKHKTSEQSKETEMVKLTLTKVQVESLKKAANVDIDTSSRRPYSRYEVLAAHIWRSFCKTRGHESKELRGVGIGIDARYRLPSFPKKYFGNTAFVVAAKGHAGDLLAMPIGFSCERIREAIESVTEEYIWYDIEFMKRLDDFSICQELRALRSTQEPYVNPNPGVISWLSMPLYGLDFGWGSEIHVSPGTHNYNGLSLVLPARQAGDVIVFVSLQVAHVHMFKQHFYDIL
ncbi:hypothetical protein V2J09_004199 [Rumex salicifolius]